MNVNVDVSSNLTDLFTPFAFAASLGRCISANQLVMGFYLNKSINKSIQTLINHQIRQSIFRTIIPNIQKLAQSAALKMIDLISRTRVF
jgi:hypothetical protein